MLNSLNPEDQIDKKAEIYELIGYANQTLDLPVDAQGNLPDFFASRLTLIEKLEEMVEERRSKTYNWAAWNLSLRTLYACLSIYWTTVELDGRFYDTFINIRTYLTSLTTLDGSFLLGSDMIRVSYISLFISALFTSNNQANLDLTNFETIFVTTSLDKQEIETILVRSGIYQPDDQILQVSSTVSPPIEEALKNLNLTVETIAGPDQVVTDELAQIILKNIKFMDLATTDQLSSLTSTVFSTVKKDPLPLPNLLLTPYGILAYQRNLIQVRIDKMGDGKKKENLRKRVAELTGLIPPDSRSDQSPLKDFIGCLQAGQIRVKVRVVDSSMIVFNQQTIDLATVKTSYLTELRSFATSTSQKVSFMIKKKGEKNQKYEILQDYSVWLGKLLATYQGDLTQIQTLKTTFFGVVIYQKSLDFQVLTEKVKDVHLSTLLKGDKIVKNLKETFTTVLIHYLNKLNLTTAAISYLSRQVGDYFVDSLTTSDPSLEPQFIGSSFWDRLSGIGTKVLTDSKEWLMNFFNIARVLTVTFIPIGLAYHGVGTVDRLIFTTIVTFFYVVIEYGYNLYQTYKQKKQGKEKKLSILVETKDEMKILREEYDQVKETLDNLKKSLTTEIDVQKQKNLGDQIRIAGSDLLRLYSALIHKLTKEREVNREITESFRTLPEKGKH